MPKQADSISSVIAPGLSIVGVSLVKSNTVLSIPTLHGPPSNINGILPFISSYTNRASVGLTLPLILADGAANGKFDRLIVSNASSLFGILIPTVSRPAVVTYGTKGCFFNTIVKGPGENFSHNKYADSGISTATIFALFASSICTINGLSCGLPFARKIFLTAFALSAFAAKP